MNAGHITTVNLIGNLVFSLLENPEEFKRLQENQNSLIKSAIEKSLRYRSSAQFVTRVANTDVTLSEEGDKEERQDTRKIKKVKRLHYFLDLPITMIPYLRILKDLILLVKTYVIWGLELEFIFVWEPL